MNTISSTNRICTLRKFFTALLLSLCLDGIISHQIYAEPAAMAKPPIQAFHAKYVVESRGIKVAHMQLELEQYGQEWLYHTRMKSYGLGAVFMNVERLESSLLKLDDNQRIIPLRYTSTEIRRGDKTSSVSTFNYDDNRLVSNNPTLQTLNIPAHAHTLQSLLLTLAIDMENANLQKTYTVLSKDKFKHYDINIEGEEIIKTPLGQIKTIKLKRQNGSKEYYNWLAPKFNWVTIKMEQYHKNKLKFKAVIADYQTNKI